MAQRSGKSCRTVGHLSLEDDTAARYWDRMVDELPAFQFGLYESDTLIAHGYSVPVALDGGDLPNRGWARYGGWKRRSPGKTRASRRMRMRHLDHHRALTSGAGHQSPCDRRHARSGAAARFQAVDRAHRPNLKSRYPLTPMESYVTWKHTDGVARLIRGCALTGGQARAW